MKKLRILIDMDDVLADASAKILELFNDLNNKNVNKSYFETHDFYTYVKSSEFKSYRDYLFEPGFFGSLAVMPDSQMVVEELYFKHDVFIVSAAMEFPNSLLEKYKWLEKNFPFISWKNIILCGDKSPINGDFLIDDHVKNLATFTGQSLLFDAIHNKKTEGFVRLKNWREVHHFFKINGYL